MSGGRLPCTGGVTHLPLPTGRLPVGFVDIFTKEAEQRLPLLFRLYYPSTASYTADTTRWPTWFPDSRYAEGYVRYKYASHVYLLPVLGKMFSWFSGNLKYPAMEGAKPSSERLPVVVFSHGLAACRTTYSCLCTDLASQGYYVAALEHGDGSACLRVNADSATGEADWQWQELLPPGTPETEIRRRQVHFRSREVSECLDILESLNTGTTEGGEVFIKTSAPGDVGGDSPVGLPEFKDKLDLVPGATVAGHSFGGATTILALAKDTRFRGGIALDSWMFPVRQEEDIKVGADQRLLFINCEKFQTPRNLETMRRYERREDRLLPLTSNVLTIRRASHYAPSDIPLILENSWLARTFITSKDESGLAAHRSVLLNSELVSAWMLHYLRGESVTLAAAYEKHAHALQTGIDS